MRPPLHVLHCLLRPGITIAVGSLGLAPWLGAAQLSDAQIAEYSSVGADVAFKF